VKAKISLVFKCRESVLIISYCPGTRFSEYCAASTKITNDHLNMIDESLPSTTLTAVIVQRRYIQYGGCHWIRGSHATIAKCYRKSCDKLWNVLKVLPQAEGLQVRIFFVLIVPKLNKCDLYSRHRKTHDRPYHCGLCPQKYALKTDLERHGAQHENASARFHCTWPGCKHEGSVRKDNLLKHMKRSHLDKKDTNVNGEEREIRKKELFRLYKKATENEKVLTAQRTRKLTLLEAVISGDEPMVRHLLDNLGDMQTSDGPESSSLSEAILRGAQDGNPSIVSLLIAKGAPVDVKSRYGDTPLWLAAKNGHEAIVRCLIEKGAAVDSKDYFGRTALAWATEKGHEAMAKYLIEKGATVDSKDKSGNTPLLWAIRNGHETVVKWLIEKGAAVDSNELWEHGTVVSC
jgi:hypothetical protein